jgi:hypothetical protein
MSYEIINGLGEFLAKRIKEEVVAYAMTNVKKYLENQKDKNPTGRTPHFTSQNGRLSEEFQTRPAWYVPNRSKGAISKMI